MIGLDELRAAADPPAQFLIAWTGAMELGASHLSLSIPADHSLAGALAAALGEDDGANAVAKCCEVLEGAWTDGTSTESRRRRAGLLLGLMRAIDDAMAQVHPRSRLLPPGFAPPAPPEWVKQTGEHRSARGYYAKTDTHYLIPRGPFGRNAREPFHEAGFSLPDQFAYLGCGPKQLAHDAGAAKIEIRVVAQGSASGVPVRPKRAGRERVTFMPLAEANTDLTATISEIDGVRVIDVEKGSTFSPLTAFMRAARDNSDNDILIGPELAIDAGDLLTFADALADGPSPRLIVAGSGLMPCSTDAPPLNEAVVMNGLGAELWRHRKVWPYGMGQDTYERLDIKGLPKTGQLMERISAGDVITVADVDALGRCVVLICQDIMMSLMADLLRTWQPDWVIVPILDSGTDLERWPSRRAAELSGESQARFLIVSSLTMVHWLKDKSAVPEEAKMGAAIGPRKIAVGNDDLARQGKDVACESPDRRHGTVEWRGHRGWKTFTAGFE